MLTTKQFATIEELATFIATAQMITDIVLVYNASEQNTQTGIEAEAAMGPEYMPSYEEEF